MPITAKRKTVDIKALIPEMSAFMDKLIQVDIDLNLEPKKGHKAICIKYANDIQMSREFLDELIASTLRFVYSRAKQGEIILDLKMGREESDAWMLLRSKAKNKFRESSQKGQFSELLLYNLLLYNYNAVPIIRKMKLTTNPNVERHGADAMHLGRNSSNGYIFYLGEAKTYTSSFKTAFKNAITSILDTFNNHKKELDLYKYEDFLEPEIKQIASEYIDGKIPDAETLLVSVITFKVNKPSLGKTDQDTVNSYFEIVKKELAGLKYSDFPKVDKKIINKLRFFFLPIDDLDSMLKNFKTDLGI